MKKYFLSICILFACFSVKAQTACDTSYVMFTMVDTTNTGGTIDVDRAFGAFGYVEWECFDIDGSPSPYKTVKRYLKTNYDVYGAPFIFIHYFVIR